MLAKTRVKKRRLKLKPKTRGQKFIIGIHKVGKPYQPYKYQIRYGILISGFVVLGYWDPALVKAVQDSALAGIDNTAGFLRALYAKLDEMLSAILALVALWVIGVHRKDKKNGN